MDSKQIPTDPILRLHLGLLWIKKEWKLSVGFLVAAGLSLLVAGSGPESRSSPWGPRELQTLSGLPLAPNGSGRPEDSGNGISAKEVEDFVKLQRELSKMPQPDLLDGKKQ